jgi:hypothetical protein
VTLTPTVMLVALLLVALAAELLRGAARLLGERLVHGHVRWRPRTTAVVLFWLAVVLTLVWGYTTRPRPGRQYVPACQQTQDPVRDHCWPKWSMG